MPTGPDRPDMPVIDGSLLNQLKGDLNAGKIDMNPPYSPLTQKMLRNKAPQVTGGEQPSPVKEALLRKKIRAAILSEMKKRG